MISRLIDGGCLMTNDEIRNCLVKIDSRNVNNEKNSRHILEKDPDKKAKERMDRKPYYMNNERMICNE